MHSSGIGLQTGSVEISSFTVRFLLFHDNYRLLAASCLQIKNLGGKS